MCVQANRSPTRDTRPVISTSETAAPSSRATKRARRRPTLSGARPVAGYTIVPRLEIISSLSTSPARRSRIAPTASAGSHVSRKRSTPTVVRGTAALTAAPYDQWGRCVALPDGRSAPLRGGERGRPAHDRRGRPLPRDVGAGRRRGRDPGTPCRGRAQARDDLEPRHDGVPGHRAVSYTHL